MRERRQALDPRLGVVLAGRVLERIAPPYGAVVGGFWPIEGEIDPRPLMLALAARGHPLCLPVAGARGTPLLFRLFHFGDALIPGRFGTREPPPDAAAIEPDWLVVPLLAFDRQGNRLGFGAGYYDATLALLRTRRRLFALGVAFAAQEVPNVPAGEGDQRLDAVATEAELVLV